MSTTSPQIGDPSTLAKQWQFPLLAVSIVFFAAALARVFPRAAPPSFEDRLRAIRTQLNAGQYVAAHDALAQELVAAKPSEAQARVLHRLLAETIHAAERRHARHSVDNADRIIAHLRAARSADAAIDPADLIRMADAHEWAGRRSDAIAVFRQAISAGAADAGRVRRRLIEWAQAAGAAYDEAVDADLAAMLSDAATPAEELQWAIAQQVDRWLTRNKAGEALALLDAMEPRLEGTPYKHELSFERARCLAAAGRRAEAERLLRELRNRPGPRDDLWARSGLLLARIHQDDARPQVALSFYDEVQREIRSGPRYVECLTGRAQALSALGDYDNALEAYTRLVHLASAPKSAEAIDRDVIRAGLTAAAAYLNANDRPVEGVRFLQLARKLVDAADVDQQIAYASEDASLNLALAAVAAAQENAAHDESTLAATRGLKNEFYRAAGDALSQLATLRAADESRADDALWQAVDAYAAAGETVTVARVLERFVGQRRASPRRVAALLRLGRLRQAAAEYGAAIDSYEQILREYPRTQDALQSLVPLAACLLARGGASSARAEKVLLNIVDEAPDAEPLFDPRAPEYGDALFTLGELLYTQKRNEEAVARFEAFLALYPDDARNRTVRFMLADAYRRSGSALMHERATTSDADLRARVDVEARQRVLRAAGLFERVVADDSAASDVLATPFERARVRSAWLYRGDCLFDLGQFAEARDVYAEAAWRFDNELTAITASMQLVHCHRRMGRSVEGRAALERLRWQVRKTPELAFAQRPGAPDKTYWIGMVDRMIEAGIH